MKIPEEEINTLVEDYINANDINNYNLEDLENNSEFMQRAIIKSNDKELYHFCSNELKINLDFIKFLISKFHADLDYVNKVTGYFFENNEDKTFKLELMIYLSEFKDNNLSVYYKKKVDAYIFKTLKNIKDVIDNPPNEKDKVESSLGFGIVEEMYKNSQLVTNTFAKHFLEEIFGKQNSNYEKILHKIFSSDFEFKNYGISNFIIDFISLRDKDLAKYIENNIKLISELISDSVVALNSWDEKAKKIENGNVNFIISEAERYHYQNVFDLTIPVMEAVYYVAVAKNLEKYFPKCDVSQINIKPLSDKDKRLFNYIVSLMENTFNDDLKNEFNNFIDTQKNEYNGIFEYPITSGRK